MMQRLMNTPEGGELVGAHQPPGQAVGPDRLSPPHRRGGKEGLPCGEMEDKLNAILNDPSAMGADHGAGPVPGRRRSPAAGLPPAGEAAQGAEQTGAREAEAPASAGSAPPALAGGEDPLAALGGDRPRHDPDGDAAAAGVSGEDDRTVALLNALRPFLKESRLAKLDRAVQISRLARVIRVLFRGMGEGGGAMYNRYIPQNGTYTRVVEQDGPEEGARRPAPHPPGPEGGRTGPGAPQDLHPGQPGARPEEEAAGLPLGRMGFGGLGDLLSGEKSPLNALFGGDKGGDQRHPESPPAGGAGQRGYPADPDHPAPAGGGGQHGPGHHPGAAAPAGAGG